MSDADEAIEVASDFRFATVPEAVLYDEAISAQAMRLYAVLVRHTDRNAEAWPRLSTLATLLHTSRDSIKRWLGELTRRGWVTCTARTRSNGSQTTNRYTVHAVRRGGAGLPPHPSAGLHPLPGANLHRPDPESVDPEPEGTTDPPTPHGQQALAVAPASPPAVAAPARPPRGGMDLTWQAFWDAYPRKAGKIAARKAWDQALRRGVDPAVIVAGARRYRADPNREDQYTAHPASWLNAGRWEDDPEPARQARATMYAGAAGTMAAYRSAVEAATAREEQQALAQARLEHGVPPVEAGDDAAAVRALLRGAQ